MLSRPSISSKICGACATTPSARIDALVLPTAPTIYTIEQVLADPIGLNSRLGTYTNFVNLLDHVRSCGAGVDAAGRHAVRRDAAGARRARMRRWRRSGAQFHAATGLPLGALKYPQPPLARDRGASERRNRASRWSARISPACRSTANCAPPAARLIETRHDRAALPALRAARHARRRSPACCGSKTAPARPSRSRSGRCRRARSAALSPRCRRRLSIGTLELDDGRAVKGFLVEAEAVDGARDISSFGGWRAFMAQNQHACALERRLTSALVDQAHMRGDNAPAFRKPHPGLHLPADFSGALARWNSVDATAWSRP